MADGGTLERNRGKYNTASNKTIQGGAGQTIDDELGDKVHSNQEVRHSRGPGARLGLGRASL